MWRSGARLFTRGNIQRFSIATRQKTIATEQLTFHRRWDKRYLSTESGKPGLANEKVTKEVNSSSDVDVIATKANEMVTIPRVAKLLGFGGVIPFVAGAVGTIFFPDPLPIARALQLYGSSILSFLGAVHWGVALRTSIETGVTVRIVRDLVYGVTPALMAWGSSLTQPSDGLYLLAGSFGVAYVYDVIRFGAGSEIPSWYRQLRLPLSIFAITSCFIGHKRVSRAPVEVGLCPRGNDSTIVETNTKIVNDESVKLKDTPQHNIINSDKTDIVRS